MVLLDLNALNPCMVRVADKEGKGKFFFIVAEKVYASINDLKSEIDYDLFRASLHATGMYCFCSGELLVANSIKLKIQRTKTVHDASSSSGSLLDVKKVVIKEWVNELSNVTAEAQAKIQSLL
jgi:hypothetical protein